MLIVTKKGYAFPSKQFSEFRRILTSRLQGVYQSKAGLLTLLHSEAPSRQYDNGLRASEPQWNSQLRDSRGFAPHSQLIAVKRTFMGILPYATAKVATFHETTKFLGKNLTTPNYYK